MEIKISEFGRIKQGTLKTGRLTILCGPNNFGKTYVAYLIYGTYNFFRNNVFKILKDNEEKFLEDKYLELNFNSIINTFLDKENLEKLSKAFKEKLDTYFNYDEVFFKNTRIDVEIFKEELEAELRRVTQIVGTEEAENGEISEAIYFRLNAEKNSIYICNSKESLPFHFFENMINDILFSKAFILPSAREGLNLLKNELNINRSVLIDTLISHKNKEINPFKIMERIVTRYSQPISEYIEFINSLEGKVRKQGNYFKLANSLSAIVDGTYTYENTQIYFKPHNSDMKLPLHMVSSTVRSLAGLYLYLKYENNISLIVIDEPELNLHPDNQRKMARLLAEVANTGINVLISTHSNYLMTEINNLIMLSNSFGTKNQIMKKYGYKKSQILNKSDVVAYLVDKETIEPMEMSKEGIIVSTFNNVIDSMNEVNDEIYYSMEN